MCRDMQVAVCRLEFHLYVSIRFAIRQANMLCYASVGQDIFINRLRLCIALQQLKNRLSTAVVSMRIDDCWMASYFNIREENIQVFAGNYQLNIHLSGLPRFLQ